MFKLILILLPILLYSQSFEFLEDFNDNSNNWKTANDSIYQLKVEDGFYKYSNKNELIYMNFKDLEFNEFYPWEMEIELTHRSGVDNQSYGVIWGASNSKNYYMFGITANGFYKVIENDNGKKEELMPYTKVKDILNNSQESNKLYIRSEAGLVFYYINDNLVFQTDQRYPSGNKMCLYVGGEQEVWFNSIKYRQLPKPPINLIKDPDTTATPINLGENVNSKTTEKSPFMKPDGSGLFFSREVGDDTEIFYSELDQNVEFSLAQKMPFPLNNDGPNSVISSSVDGNTLLLINTYKEDGSSAGGGISITKKLGAGKWEVPKKVEVDGLYNDNRYVNYHLSADNKYLMISSEMKEEGLGDLDLYVAKRIDSNRFDKPIHLGNIINTIGADFSPFLAPDNKTLYFSSYGHSGYGSADNFVTRRLDDTWQNWSKPENLGKSINSKSWDAYLKLDTKGDYAYIVSSNNSLGESDIFKIQVPESAKPEAVMLVSGKVYNSKTNESLEADVVYTELLSGDVFGQTRSSLNDGSYKVILNKGYKYGIKANKNGFYPTSDNLDLENISLYSEVEKDLYLTPLEVGATIRLNNLFFDNNKSDLKAESFPELQSLIDLLNTNPSMKIQINGHTDSKGSDSYNLNLSKERAKAVLDHLANEGIESSRVDYKGFGETKPTASNETEEGRAKNRRVEFEIINI